MIRKKDSRKRRENVKKLEELFEKPEVRILITKDPMDRFYAIDMPNLHIPQRQLIKNATDEQIMNDMFSSDIIIYLNEYTIALVDEKRMINLEAFEGIEIFNELHEHNMVILNMMANNAPVGMYQLLNEKHLNITEIGRLASKYFR